MLSRLTYSQTQGTETDASGRVSVELESVLVKSSPSVPCILAIYMYSPQVPVATAYRYFCTPEVGGALMLDSVHSSIRPLSGCMECSHA